MGRKLFYRPGSFYRVDDRTGFPQRAERTRKQWNNLQVDESVWEARQPQDLVKGVKDDQTVPDARPLAPNVFVGPIYIQVAADVPVGSTFIPLETTAGLTVGDEIGVILITGEVFITGVAFILDGGILTYDALPNSVPAGDLPIGNQIVDYRRAYGRAPTSQGPILTEDLNYLCTEDGGFLLQEN